MKPARGPVLLLLAVLLAPAALLAPHLASGAWFSAADVRGGMFPFRSEGAPPPRNWELTDPATQFEPWDRFAAREAAAGRVPLWNPLEGAGAPHAANAQSAVFFPLTYLPGLFGPGPGLLLRAYVRVALALGLACLLFRDMGCTRGAALFGGIAYGFSGFTLLGLPWPHTNVSLFLPALLLAARRTARSERPARAILALPPLVALQFLGGHPETSLLICLATALYLAWMLAAPSGLGARARAARFLLFGLAGAIGAVMAAVHLLPFLAYLRESEALAGRGAAMPRGTPLLHALRLFAPTFLGHPVDGTGWSGVMLLGSGIGYVGIAPLVFAFVPSAEPRKRRERRFFLGLALLAIAAGYGIPPVREIVDHTPLLRMGIDDRFLLWFAFGAAGAGALGLDALVRREAPEGFAGRPGFVLAALAAGLAAAALLGAGIGAFRRFLLVDAALGRPAGSPALRAEPDLLLAAGLSIAALAGLVLASVLLARRISRRGAAARAAIAAVVLLEALDAGFLSHERYLPRTLPAVAAAESPSLAALREGGRGRALLLGPWTARPNVAADLGVEDIRVYDAMTRASYAAFLAALGPAEGPLQAIERFRRPFVDLLAVDRIAMPWDRDLETEEVPLLARASERVEVAPGRPLEVAIGRAAFPVAGVALRLEGTRGGETLRIALQAGGREVAAREVPARYAVPAAPFIVLFRPEAAVESAPLGVEIEAHGGKVVLLGGPDGRPFLALRRRKAETYPILRDDLALRIYENPHAFPRAFVLGRERRVAGVAEAIALLAKGEVDPHETALLEGPPPLDPRPDPLPLGAGGCRPAEVLERRPGFARIRPPAGAGGTLVMSECWDAGWRAEVDGRESPVLRAFATLQAVRLPAGGAREVVLRYDPPAFRWGLGASALATAAWALGFWLAWRRS